MLVNFSDQSQVGSIVVVVGIGFRCCEKTMQVMRASRDAILTIVQVLLYDPLYVWTISRARGYQLQHPDAADATDVTDANMNTTSVDLLDQSVSRPKRRFLFHTDTRCCFIHFCLNLSHLIFTQLEN